MKTLGQIAHEGRGNWGSFAEPMPWEDMKAWQRQECELMAKAVKDHTLAEQTQQSDDIADVVSLALRRAFYLGQKYWQQADSDNVSENQKADKTAAQLQALIDQTRAIVLKEPKGE
jgi:hypothetical protein